LINHTSANKKRENKKLTENIIEPFSINRRPLSHCSVKSQWGLKRVRGWLDVSQKKIKIKIYNKRIELFFTFEIAFLLVFPFLPIYFYINIYLYEE